MAQTDEEYAASHLSHEFMEMLVAAATWACSRDDSDSRGLPYKLPEIAEYAAFSHARCLLELFCHTPKGSPGPTGAARELLGHGDALPSDLWERWQAHLNRAAAHLARRHEGVDPIVDGEHLKDQVVDLAREVVRLWVEFEALVSDPVRSELRRGRATAFDESNVVTDRLAHPPLDWLADDPAGEWGERKWWPAEP